MREYIDSREGDREGCLVAIESGRERVHEQGAVRSDMVIELER